MPVQIQQTSQAQEDKTNASLEAEKKEKEAALLKEKLEAERKDAEAKK